MQKRYVVKQSNLVGRNDFFEIEVDPPLVFVNAHDLPNQPGNPEPATVTGSLCAVCVCEMGNNLTRVVIHKATRLKGETGICYGSGPSRIMDGFTTMHMAMEHLGYELVDSLEEKPYTPTAFEVWPRGSKHWILTHDESFAEWVYNDMGAGSVIAYTKTEYKPQH